MIESINGLRKRWRKEGKMATKVTRDISEINAKVTELSGNIKKLTADNKNLDRSLKLDPTNTTLLTQKTENLKKQIQLAADKVKVLREEQAKMKADVDKGTVPVEEYQKLTVKIAQAEAQQKNYNAQLEKINDAKFEKLEDGLNKARHAATVALAAIAALGAAYAKMGDDLSDISERFNVSAEKFQIFDFIFQRASGNADTYKRALENVQQMLSSAEKGSSRALKGFAALGIGMEEIKGKGAGDALQLIIDRLRIIEDYDQRVTVANELLTSSGTDVAMVAALSAQEIDNLTQKCAENGLISQETADKAAALNDRWEEFLLQGKNMIMMLGDSLIPMFYALIDIASFLIPILQTIAKVISFFPSSLQVLIVLILILISALPKLITLIKSIDIALKFLGANPIAMKILIICAAVALLISMLYELARLLGLVGKKNVIDIDTRGFGVDMANATASAGNISTTNNSTTVTNYYDFSTQNNNINNQTDIDEVAEQLRTKVKVGGGG